MKLSELLKSHSAEPWKIYAESVALAINPGTGSCLISMDGLEFDGPTSEFEFIPGPPRLVWRNHNAGLTVSLPTEIADALHGKFYNLTTNETRAAFELVRADGYWLELARTESLKVMADAIQKAHGGHFNDERRALVNWGEVATALSLAS